MLHSTMQDIEEFLNFTMETCDDFTSGWLATLDTDIRISEMNRIDYKYYEKPESSNICIQSHG